MDQSNVIELFSGLALFLYGMHLMSSGLESAAGERLKNLLEKYTRNRFMALFLGAGITALVQSSSATTVMVIGFVNSGMMTLASAVWVIMGANVGTTVTGLLITLKVGDLMPWLIIIGVLMTLFFQNAKGKHTGQILIGLGLLFMGMANMSDAMSPLRDSQEFISLMTYFSNPVLGILAGALFTAAIQSSSASIGILQGLAASGVITLDQAIFVLFGQNIGTCITALMACIGLNRNAKRVTAVHLMFNIIGTLIFTIITLLCPFTDFMESLTPGNVQTQIANTHVVFNIVTTLMLFPFGAYMAQLAKKIIHKTGEEDEITVPHVEFLTLGHTTSKEGGLGSSAIYGNQLRQELQRMMTMAKENVQLSFKNVLLGEDKYHEQVVQTEAYIDYLNKEISTFIGKVIATENNESSAETVSSLFTITGNIERIGDHANNISDYSTTMKKRSIKFSEAATVEIEQMRDISIEGIDKLQEHSVADIQWLTKVAALEQKIDDMTAQFRKNHLRRMRDGICHGEEAILFAELLTDFERVGDHILNIAEEYTAIQTRVYG
ncbi:MAG: Na/Pi cotransporter family protein [Eubacteriales bacterium]